jgi:hypothetical protein
LKLKKPPRLLLKLKELPPLKQEKKKLLLQRL